MNLTPVVQKGIALIATLLAGGCAAIPDGLVAITPFDIHRYLGTWYEIARLDHSFERDLTQVTAEYSMEEGGLVRVVNKGYDSARDRWKTATGRAYFVGSPQVGSLKVSFFWPFYGGYNILALDQEDYSHALVCGPSRSYLWLLSRTPELDERIVAELVSRARSMGFDTDRLIFVVQEGQETIPAAGQR